MHKKGFTLIELLVVIAIIGILSSVVLANLNSARTKGADAAIQSNLSNLRSQAELYYDTTGNGSYGAIGSASSFNFCFTTAANTLFVNAKIRQFIDAAYDASGNNSNIRCGAFPVGGPVSSYIVSVPLKSSGFWCIDSQGASKRHANAIGAATACP